MLGIAASMFTYLPLIHTLCASSWRTVSRKPNSAGRSRGGMHGYRMKVRKAQKFVSVIVRRTTAKVLWDGAT